jgi:diaminopimelate decarboxylase
VQVTGVEKIFGKPAHEVFTDGSYVHMPSATIRTRQHRLQFYDLSFSRVLEDASSEKAGFLSGNTTLSSDRLFPGIIYFPSRLKEGDYIILEDVGAYCATQHMDFLNKAPCPEVLVRKNGSLELITERGTPTDKIRYALQSPQRIGGVHEDRRF